MAMPQDKTYAEFLKQTGERVMEEGKQEKPKDFGDELLDLHGKLIKQQMVAQTFGVKIGEQGGGEAPASVTNKALELMDKGVVRAEAAADAKQQDIKVAHEEANKAKEELYKTQFDTLKMITDDYKETIKGLKAGGSPMTAVEILDQGDKLIDAIMKRIPHPEPTTHKPELSGDLQIQLEQMRENHELELRKLDIELARMKQDFDLKFLEFGDNRESKKTEYQDKRQFREKAMDSFSDLVGAAAESVTKERGETGAVAKSASAGKPEEALEARVSKFICGTCSSAVTVPPGATKVTCEECGTEYEIKGKG